MITENIVLQSAGSLSVAVLALLMTILQACLLRKPQLQMVCLGGCRIVFRHGLCHRHFSRVQRPSGPINWFGGVLEFSALICLVHCLYGLTFDYLKIDGKLYHLIAGAFHAVILVILWSSTVFVADEFIARDFTGLAKPFWEAALGPLGPLFHVLRPGGLPRGGFTLGQEQTARQEVQGVSFRRGIVFWIVLGFHEGSPLWVVPAVQYVMEYGFIGLSAVVVLWIVFSNYMDVLAEDKYRVITEFSNDGILIIQGGKVIFENPACSHLFGHPVLSSQQGTSWRRISFRKTGKDSCYYKRLLESGK